MKYALNLAEDGRILSVTFEQYASAENVIVDSIPEGNIANFLYKDGEFIYDESPSNSSEDQPSVLDRIEAQVVYTAMVTNTLLEGY